MLPYYAGPVVKLVSKHSHTLQHNVTNPTGYYSNSAIPPLHHGATDTRTSPHHSSRSRLAADTSPSAPPAEITHLFYSKENDWGFSHFMTWNEVLDEDRGYIKNDTITLQVGAGGGGAAGP